MVAGRQLDEPGGLQFSQTLTETILAERELLEQAVIARRDMNDENERHDVVRPAGYIGEFEY